MALGIPIVDMPTINPPPFPIYFLVAICGNNCYICHITIGIPSFSNRIF
jgi:hypothetical protein